MEHQKEIKRSRDVNWTAAEKYWLRKCVKSHITIIEDKMNDASMIAKKKEAWKQVRINMLAAGFDRDAHKLRQQWTRMKLAARKSFRSERRAATATGNFCELSTVDKEACIIQRMIAPDLVEDTMLIDSNSYIVDEFYENTNSTISDVIDPIASFEVKLEIEENDQNDSHLQCLRTTPKSKSSINEERQRHMGEQLSNSDELHFLQAQLLRGQIKHQKTIEEHENELHYLKVELLGQQIAHQKRINTQENAESSAHKYISKP